MEDKTTGAQSPGKNVEKAGLVGRYRILAKLGQGGMGCVYKAQDTKLDRIVALKILSPVIAMDKMAIQRFQREAKSNANLHHPHIVTLYDFETVGSLPFFTMDFIDGGSLKSVMEKEELPFKRSCELLLQILDAVSYAHRQGLIHRDIKPANILIDKEGIPFVADFGLAKALREETQISHTGAVIGTPAYMSPEQAEGDPDNPVDIRSDIYSVGAMFYEMLTHKPPFEGHTSVRILHKVLYEEVKSLRALNPGIPEELERICLKALAKKKEQRYQNATEMMTDIRHYLEEKVSDVAEPSASQRTQIRLWARYAVGVSILAAVFLLLLVILLWRLLSQSAPTPNVSDASKNTTLSPEPTQTKPDKPGTPAHPTPDKPQPQSAADIAESEAKQKWEEINRLPAAGIEKKLELLEQFLAESRYARSSLANQAIPLRDSLKKQVNNEESARIYKQLRAELPSDNPLLVWENLDRFPGKYMDTVAGNWVTKEKEECQKVVLLALQQYAHILEDIMQRKNFAELTRIDRLGFPEHPSLNPKIASPDPTQPPSQWFLQRQKILEKMGQQNPLVGQSYRELLRVYEQVKTEQSKQETQHTAADRPPGEKSEPTPPSSDKPGTDPLVKSYYSFMQDELPQLVVSRKFNEGLERLKNISMQINKKHDIPDTTRAEVENSVLELEGLKRFFYETLNRAELQHRIVQIGSISGKVFKVEGRHITLRLKQNQGQLRIPIERLKGTTLADIVGEENQNAKCLYYLGLSLFHENELALAEKYLTAAANQWYAPATKLMEKLAQKQKQMRKEPVIKNKTEATPPADSKTVPSNQKQQIAFSTLLESFRKADKDIYEKCCGTMLPARLKEVIWQEGKLMKSTSVVDKRWEAISEKKGYWVFKVKNDNVLAQFRLDMLLGKDEEWKVIGLLLLAKEHLGDQK